jgi:hypothetical protein
MLFLVEVNTKHRSNLIKLCMKNTTPHVGTLGQNFSSQVKSETYLKHYLHSPVEGIWNPFAQSNFWFANLNWTPLVFLKPSSQVNNFTVFFHFFMGMSKSVFSICLG